MKTSKLFFVLVCSLAVAGCGGSGSGEGSAGATAPPVAAKTAIAPPPPAQGEVRQPPRAAPPEPYPRLLPMQLVAPAIAQAGMPLEGISVSMRNPGDEAPNARLRLIIHDKDHRHDGVHQELSPDNVKLEVQEGDSWKPVLLGVVEGGVIGAIGSEGVVAHRERHRRGGFAIPSGMDKTWQLRLTFGVPGTYTLVSAISPNNGSLHLAQPAHTTIEVQ